MSPETARSAVLDDGRRISWAEYGSAAGAPLVVLHGTPGSRLEFRFLHEPATAAGVRVVAPERPGYGRSSPVPGGVTYLGYAEDLRRLLDHLRLATVTLAGASGGGGFALAAAIADPRRYRRLVLVSAAVPAPRSALRGTALPVRALLFLAAHAPALARKAFAAQRSADLDSAVSRWATRRMPAADQRVLGDPTLRAHLAEDVHEGLRQGPDAAVQDLRLGRPGLGLELGALTVDTVMVHGVEDENVSIGIPRWLAAQVPAARLVEVPGVAHLFMLERPDLILSQVVH